jgi:O-antigen/teichoic acid export membrane protein
VIIGAIRRGRLRAVATPVAPPVAGAGRPLAARAVLRTGALSFGALVVLGLSRLVHGSLVGHATGPEAYGVIGSLIGITYVAGLFIPAGLASAMAKFVAQNRGRSDPAAADAVYLLLRRISDASAVVLGVLSALAARLLFPVTLTDAVAVGLLAATFCAYSVDKAAFYGFDQVARYSRLEVAGSGLAILATVAVIVAGSTVYLLPLALGYAVVVAGARLSRLQDARPVPTAVPAGHRREVLAFAGLAALGAGSAAGLLQGLPLLASAYAAGPDVGYLVTSVTLVSPLYLLPRVLGLALFPAMSHAQGGGDGSSVRRSADLSMRGTVVALAAPLAVALPLAQPLLRLYGGDDFAAGAPELRLMLVATYVSVLATGPINALSSGSLRDSVRPVGFAIAGCVSGLLLAVPLGRAFGGAGVAVAYLAAMLLTSGGPVAAAWRRWRMPWTGTVVRGAIVVAGASALAAAADTVDGLGAARLVIQLVAALAAGALAVLVFARDGRALLTRTDEGTA